MVTQKQRKLLTKLYQTPDQPNSYGRIDALYRIASKYDKSITKQIVYNFLKEQTSYTLHKITPKNFVRRKIISSAPKKIASCDLADFSTLARYNNGYRYVLVVIDIFSRYVQAEPVKKKDGLSVLEAMKQILDSDQFTGINRLNSDNGKEFYNKNVQSYLKGKQIKLYSVHSYEIKASIAERAIQTLKRKIYKYMTQNNTYFYLPILQKIVKSYNNSPHKSLGMDQTPSIVHKLTDPHDIQEQFYRMYKKEGSRRKTDSNKLDIGQTVRIA